MKRILAIVLGLGSFYFGLHAIASKTKNEQVKRAKVQVEKTFAMIKPDAVSKGYTGDIIKNIELNGFKIKNMKKVELPQQRAKIFYIQHKDRPFFNELINYITSGSIIALELEKINAVKDWRELIGDTNPKNAKVGTLRKMFGIDITNNAVHGSDSLSAAADEIAFFFPK